MLVANEFEIPLLAKWVWKKQAPGITNNMKKKCNETVGLLRIKLFPPERSTARENKEEGHRKKRRAPKLPLLQFAMKRGL